jgi:anti-sigma factor RsiW
MNCTSARSNWELYHDSEGDAQLYREVNDHLARCAACREWFDEQQTFEGELTARLCGEQPSVELWDQIEQALSNPTAEKPSSRLLPILRYVALAASFLGIIAAWQWAKAPLNDSPDLAGLVSAHHERLATGSDTLQYESESDLAVEAYLKSRVSFPVRCPPRQDAGFEVRGGGVLTIRDTPAAYVHGLVEAEKVSVFIFPRERLTQFGLEQDAFKDSKVVHQRIGSVEVVLSAVDQNIVVVVGRQTPDRLEQVVRAYGTYPETHSHDAA